MNLLSRSTDVFVIGGGPAGLAAAIAARARGLDVTVADCAVPPVDKACGEGVMPNGVEAARSLGLDLEAAGGEPFRGIRFYDGASSVAARFPNGEGLGLRRTVLHQMMVDRAAQVGVHLAWGAKVSAISPAGVVANDRLVRSRWIVGADGGHSQIRRWAGLDACGRNSRRYGFRRHYRVAPWSEFMEIHWGGCGQIYVTPVSPEEVCVALISRDPKLRLDDALPQFGEIRQRLAGAGSVTLERGGITASRRLRSVYRGNVALVGDASGSVDAITGEGLCLLFQQSVALADALAAGDLSRYQAAHRRIGRRPEFMAGMMLMLDRRASLRSRVIRVMAKQPQIFARMLAMHVGELAPSDFVTNGLALGWRILTI